MRNVFRSIAITVAVGASLPLDSLAAESSGGIDPVVVEQVSERRFRLVNNSDETLTYMQWLNQGESPVAYCRLSNDSITICSRDVHIGSDRKPALQEARLKPGKSVNFDALKSKAVAVGVRLKINGEERLLWCEL